MKAKENYLARQNEGAIDRAMLPKAGFSMLAIPHFLFLQPGAMLERWQTFSMAFSFQ